MNLHDMHHHGMQIISSWRKLKLNKPKKSFSPTPTHLDRKTPQRVRSKNLLQQESYHVIITRAKCGRQGGTKQKSPGLPSVSSHFHFPKCLLSLIYLWIVYFPFGVLDPCLLILPPEGPETKIFLLLSSLLQSPAWVPWWRKSSIWHLWSPGDWFWG